MILDHEKIARIKTALKFHKKGISISEIARQLKMNRNSVAKYLEILLISGQVEVKTYGTSKVYSLSQYMPVSAMMEFSSDMIVMIDSNGRIIQVNERLLLFAGVPRDTLVGQQIETTDIPFLKGIPLDNFFKGSEEHNTEILEKTVIQNGCTVYLGVKIFSTIFDDGGKGVTIIIEDITGRKTAELALAESEKKYRSVLENIQDVFYRTDPEGNLIMASPSGATVLGYNSIEEGIGRNIADMFYVDPAKRKEFLDTIYRDGSVINYEIVLKRKDGSPLNISTNSHLYYDDDGAVLGVEGIFRDVTALRTSEEIFSNFAHQSPLPIAIINPDGTYRYINRNFTGTFGYDLNDFQQGRGWFLLAFPDPDYRKKVISAWKSDLQHSHTGDVRERIFTVRCKDGSLKEVDFRPVTLSDGKQCVIYEDITSHIQARRERQFLSFIVESTDDAIIGKDIRGTILSWNNAAERLYGYTAEEIIGRHISQIIPRERRQEMDEILSKIKNGESVNSLETFRVKKDGTVIEVAVTISPITDDDGVVIGASTIARDISFKKSEEHLRAREEQYRSLVDNIAVGVYRSTGDPTGRFIWGNTSLVKILGYSSLETLKTIDVADIFAKEGGRRKLLEELKQAGFVKNREILLKRADGKTIHVMVTALAKFDPKGDLVCINGLVEDITSQRQAESQLQIMQDEIVDIIEFQPDATFIIDNEKNVIAWNSAIERLTGIKKADIIGKGDYAHAFAFYGTSRPILIDLIDSSDEELHQYYAEVKREGTALVAEVFTPALNAGMGAFLWAKASPLVDPSGNRIGAIETIRDISDSKRLQAQTGTRSMSHDGDDTGQTQVMTARANAPAGQTAELLSLIYLSNALRMAQDGITILDLSGRCIWANESLNSLLCTGSSEAITGKSIASYIASEMRKTALDQISEVRRLGHAEFPLSLMTPGGRVPVEARVSAVSDQGGELLGYMAILRRIDSALPGR